MNLPEETERMRIPHQSFPAVRGDAGKTIAFQIHVVHNIFLKFEVGVGIADLTAQAFPFRCGEACFYANPSGLSGIAEKRPARRGGQLEWRDFIPGADKKYCGVVLKSSRVAAKAEFVAKRCLRVQIGIESAFSRRVIDQFGRGRCFENRSDMGINLLLFGEVIHQTG